MSEEKKETVLFTEEEVKEIEGAKKRLLDKPSLMSHDDLKSMMKEVNEMRSDVNSMFSQAQQLLDSIQPTLDKIEKKK